MLPLNSLVSPTASLLKFCASDDQDLYQHKSSSSSNQKDASQNEILHKSANNDDINPSENFINSCSSSSSSSCCIVDSNPECFLLKLNENEAEPETETQSEEMADKNSTSTMRSANSEMVSSKSSSRTMTSQQSTSSVVISTSNIQLKQKQEVVSSNQSIQQQMTKSNQIVQQQQQQQQLQNQQNLSQKQQIQKQQSVSKTEVIVGNNSNAEHQVQDQQQLLPDEDLKKEKKKKKKVKKTESFSVIEVFHHKDDKMKHLAEKYEVFYDVANNQSPDKPSLRASELKALERVDVAKLRRSFCDLTSNLNFQSNKRDDEFNYHLTERPKSSFSKFEPNNRNSEEKDCANNIKNETKSGSSICKGCNEEVFAMEMIKAEKGAWHRRCFRCTTCKKALTFDTYESNAGNLYCKPHFKELFQPKAVFESQEEMILKKLKRKPEVIIRENQPVELPPDVIRATIQPATADLEELSVDVKSKFELFENFKESEQQEKERREPVKVNRSTSVLSKLAKRYEGGAMVDQVGVTDNELNGAAPEVVSEDEDDEHIPTGKIQPIEEINYNLDDVKSKWEAGMNSKKEEISKHRQEEMAKFRTRLCLGKNREIKEMYEKAVESNTEDASKTKTFDLDELDLKKKRDIKEMFEKGIVNNNNNDEDETRLNEGESRSTIDLDRDVFESGVAKSSRNLFQNLDKQVASGNGPAMTNAPKKITFKNPNSIVGINDQQVEGEVIKSSDIVPDQVRAEDVGSKFKFFETFQENQEKQRKEKVFRITPPRDSSVVKMDSPEREIYRDPNIVRSTDDTEQIKIPVARTASKMLSVFKRLEEKAANDEVDATQRRGLKQFTPPRETRLERKDSSEEEEGSSEYESEEEDEQQYEQNGNGIHNEQDKFLEEVGSLARAKSLRAKFERWENSENEENAKNQGGRVQEELSNGNSIESAKALRAKFEQPQQFFEPQRQSKQVQVKRFVELQNSNGQAMEKCVMCTKTVYAMEKTEAGGKIYHKQCFRCSQCKCVLRMDTFTQNQGTLYCTPHFKQLFKIKGNYDEGFGRETQKQIWMKKQQAKAASETGSETKEN